MYWRCPSLASSLLILDKGQWTWQSVQYEPEMRWLGHKYKIVEYGPCIHDSWSWTSEQELQIMPAINGIIMDSDLGNFHQVFAYGNEWSEVIWVMWMVKMGILGHKYKIVEYGPCIHDSWSWTSEQELQIMPAINGIIMDSDLGNFHQVFVYGNEWSEVIWVMWMVKIIDKMGILGYKCKIVKYGPCIHDSWSWTSEQELKIMPVINSIIADSDLGKFHQVFACGNEWSVVLWVTHGITKSMATECTR